MDIPTMVSNIVKEGHSKPQNYSNKPKHFESPLRGTTPVIREQNPKISSVESFRGKTPSGELSTTASNLIKQSKALGTRNHYKSAWKSFESWCNKEKVDPISCPLEHILNYLGSLYEKGREYNTINGHRSASSSLHKPIEGIPVGQHPSVTSLMKGISREKPPMPKYIKVHLGRRQSLEQFKQMPENDGLNLKELSFKTITLLGLTAPKRGSELTELSLDWMGRTETTFMFHIQQPSKHFKQGKKNDPIEFRKFEQDKKLSIRSFKYIYKCHKGNKKNT